MTEVTASAIKELREMTGAGMMDCKKALTETKGIIQEAVDWLRKKGLAAAAKKSGRVAAEGLVAVATSENAGAVIELNAETDFVARNDQFQALARKTAELALKEGDDVEKLKAAKDSSGQTVADSVAQLVGTIGENMTLRRSAKLSVKKGVVASYVHSAVAAGLGKIGVLVALESEGAKDKLEALGKQLAMHVAAANPGFLDKSQVSEQALIREKSATNEQIDKFMMRFAAFESGVAKYKDRMTQERSFSEKMLEAKLAELNQTLPNVPELISDFDRMNASEDRKEKSNAQKTKKLLDIFFQEAVYLLKKVRAWGDEAAIRKNLQNIKIERFFEESVLSEQVYVIDGKSKVSQVLTSAAKDVGAPVTLSAFIRFQLGEGIEKQESDFAAEVKAAAGAA